MLAIGTDALGNLREAMNLLGTGENIPAIGRSNVEFAFEVFLVPIIYLCT